MTRYAKHASALSGLNNTAFAIRTGDGTVSAAMGGMVSARADGGSVNWISVVMGTSLRGCRVVAWASKVWLIAAVAQDVRTREVLMLAWMNQEAICVPLYLRDHWAATASLTGRTQMPRWIR